MNEQSENQPENPNAFPESNETRWGGMTLRDYFAAKAIPSVVAQHFPGSSLVVAKECYAIADAMIAEREKRGRK